MSLRIRQIVVVARNLEETVSQLTHVLGVKVCYNDPNVAKFGLKNALMVIGDQFLEVVSPIENNTAAGRHLDRFGDSGYMLILQTDNFEQDKKRLGDLGVRTVWESNHPDISAVHIHPKDIGAAIVSIDQPVVPEDWPWAGKDWRDFVPEQNALKVVSANIGTTDIGKMAGRWAQILNTVQPVNTSDGMAIEIKDGTLEFAQAESDLLSGFAISMDDTETALTRAWDSGLQVSENTVYICGTGFQLI